MTKALEWITGFVALLAVWYAANTNKIAPQWTKEHPTLVLFSPVIAAGLVALYVLALLVYRVATFNDCDEAAEELQRQIKEAKADLKSKGVSVG